MHLLLAFLSYIFMVFSFVAAFPEYIPLSSPGQENNGTALPWAPIIATTILSPNNTDLTSSFPTLIYYNPLPVVNNDSLSPRQPSSLARRPINFCQSPTAFFLTSFCRYSHGHYSPLQDYMVFCQEEDLPWQGQQPSTTRSAAALSTSPAPHQFPPHHHLLPPMVTEGGSCRQDEICVDGELGEGVAYCVNKSEFGLLKQLREGSGDGDGGINGGGSSRNTNKGRRKGKEGDDGWIKVGRNGRLGGKVARMVVSGRDGLLPMESRGMNLKAGVSGEGGELDGGEGDVVVRQEKRCEDCFELKTERMGDEVDFLETEARVMLGGTVAAAAIGVVWLMVSG